MNGAEALFSFLLSDKKDLKQLMTSQNLVPHAVLERHHTYKERLFHIDLFTFPLRVLKLTFTFAMSFILHELHHLTRRHMTLCDIKIHRGFLEFGWTSMALFLCLYEN